MKSVKLGVIGCGVIGNKHLTAINKCEFADIVAVADLREDALKDAVEKYGVNKTYTEGNELLDDREIEAVILAMPTCARKKLALKAFSLNKHVLIEKPFAMNSNEARELINARGNLIAACCSSRHGNQPSAKAAKEFFNTGALGNLRVIRCRGIITARQKPEKLPPSWRLKLSLNGGGIMANWGCYDLDYLLSISGWSVKPRRVLAKTWTIPPAFANNVVPGSDAETHFSAFIQCDNDIVLTIERGEYVPSPSDGQWEIIGENGTLTLHMIPDENKKIIFTRADSEKGTISEVVWEGQEVWETCHDGLIPDFCGAILANRPPKTTLENALVIQQITDAIYESSKKSTMVEI